MTKRRKLYRLDSNVVIHGVRGDATWQNIKLVCDPLMYEPKPSVCIVTHGEVRSFAEQHQWGDLKRNQMNYLLGYFDVMTKSRQRWLTLMFCWTFIAIHKELRWAKMICGLLRLPM